MANTAAALLLRGAVLDLRMARMLTAGIRISIISDDDLFRFHQNAAALVGGVPIKCATVDFRFLRVGV